MSQVFEGAPKWVHDWRCPHCGQSAVVMFTGGDPQVPAVKMITLGCSEGHRTQIDCTYYADGDPDRYIAEQKAAAERLGLSSHHWGLNP